MLTPQSEKSMRTAVSAIQQAIANPRLQAAAERFNGDMRAFYGRMASRAPNQQPSDGFARRGDRRLIGFRLNV